MAQREKKKIIKEKLFYGKSFLSKIKKEKI